VWQVPTFPLDLDTAAGEKALHASHGFGIGETASERIDPALHVSFLETDEHATAGQLDLVSQARVRKAGPSLYRSRSAAVPRNRLSARTARRN
jgi:hypothetical protein